MMKVVLVLHCKYFRLSIVSGDLKKIDEGLINITGIDINAEVSAGDMVVTSQISDKFLPGILIGYVNQYQRILQDLQSQEL